MFVNTSTSLHVAVVISERFVCAICHVKKAVASVGYIINSLLYYSSVAVCRLNTCKITLCGVLITFLLFR